MTYIISGAVVAAVLFVLITLVTFALIMVVKRRHFKKREQDTGNGMMDRVILKGLIGSLEANSDVSDSKYFSNKLTGTVVHM